MPEAKKTTKKEVSLGEALGALRGIRRHLKAFEKLDDVIEGAAQAEPRKRAIEDEIAKLQPEIERLRTEKENWEAETKKVESHYRGRKKTLDDRHRNRAEEVAAAGQKQAQEIKAGIASLEAEHEEKKKTLQRQTAALIKEREEAARELGIVQGKLNSLKKQLTGVSA